MDWAVRLYIQTNITNTPNMKSYYPIAACEASPDIFYRAGGCNANRESI